MVQNRPVMMEYPTLDAHAHVSPGHAPKELQGTGAVLAMSLSLDEAALVVDRQRRRNLAGGRAWVLFFHPFCGCQAFHFRKGY
jgi:hypothetical protein